MEHVDSLLDAACEATLGEDICSFGIEADFSRTEVDIIGKLGLDALENELNTIKAQLVSLDTPEKLAAFKKNFKPGERLKRAAAEVKKADIRSELQEKFKGESDTFIKNRFEESTGRACAGNIEDCVIDVLKDKLVDECMR